MTKMSISQFKYKQDVIKKLQPSSKKNMWQSYIQQVKNLKKNNKNQQKEKDY